MLHLTSNQKNKHSVRIQVEGINCKLLVKKNFSKKETKEYKPNLEYKNLQINLPSFSGPLDLLLHLIKKHSVDIFDIPIKMVAQEYSGIIYKMKSIDLEIATDFLVMASTLAQIKSAMLLPNEKISEDNEEPEQDPRYNLVKQLLEYKKYKDVTDSLAKMKTLGMDFFNRQNIFHDKKNLVSNKFNINKSTKIQDSNIFELNNLFNHISQQHKCEIYHVNPLQGINLKTRMQEILDYSSLKEHLQFLDFLLYFSAKSKIDIIITFLAILELCKLNLLKIEQAQGENPIKTMPIKKVK